MYMDQVKDTLRPNDDASTGANPCPRIVRAGIYTLLDPRSHGGLECYIRALTAELEQAEVQVSWNGTDPGNSADTSGSQGWRNCVQRLLPLMTRRPTRFAARWAAECYGFRQMRDAAHQHDVIHLVGTGWDLLGFPLSRATRSAGGVITCLPAVHPGTWGDAPLDIDLYRRMDAVFVLSDFEADHLCRLGVPRKKLVRCGCAPSAEPRGEGERFRRAHRLNGRQVVLFIGRKSRAKGYHALREAIARLAERGEAVTLVSIGRPVDPPYPILDPQIDLDLGAADEMTKQDALAACDVFALPSEAESFGIVYVEAWTYGKPVICGTAPASRELVTRHGGGVVTNGTANEVASGLSSLISNPDLRVQLGEAGGHAAVNYYDTKAVIRTHLETWQRLRNER